MLLKKYKFKIGEPIKKQSWDEIITYCTAYLELVKTMLSRVKIKKMEELLETAATYGVIGPTEEAFYNLAESISENDSQS